MRIMLVWLLALFLLLVLIRMFAVCGPWGASYALSYELWSAPCAATPRGRVALWLAAHRSQIDAVAADYGVDRRAVAGVIAYEALVNVEWSNYFGFTRSSGPGKVHYKASYLTEGDPVAKQVESAGLLPQVDEADRKAILSTPSGAIGYIGAIMFALDGVAKESGYSLRCAPAAEASLYNRYDIPGASALFAVRHYPEALPGDGMGRWVRENIGYLERALGPPPAHACPEGGWEPRANYGKCRLGRIG